MISALLLIVDPVATWERIIRAQRSVTFLLCVHLLPLLLLGAAAEGYRLVYPKGWFAFTHTDPARLTQALVFELVQGLALVIMLLAGTKAVQNAGDTFHARKSFTQALTLVVHGLSPVFLLRVLLLIPGSPPWIPWALGLVLSLAILYHGVPRLLAPDPAHAFGMYLSTVLILFLATAAVYLPALLYWRRLSAGAPA